MGQAGNELVGCLESRDGFRVGTFVLVEFGIGNETYVGVSTQSILFKGDQISPFHSEFKAQPIVVQDRVSNRLGLMPASSAVGASEAKAIRISTILAMPSLELETLVALVMIVQAEIMPSFRLSSDETVAASSAPAA